MDLRRDYYEDLQLCNSTFSRFWLIGFLGLLGVLPFFLPNYTLYTLNYLGCQVLVAIGMNILVGYTGQISIGHSGFMAIGAYTCALLTVQGLIPLPVTLLLAGLAAASMGFLLGLPALRLEGPYLAIATLGFGLAVTQIIGRLSLLGGRMGIVVPRPRIGSFELDDDRALYWLIVPVTVALVWMARNLMRSRIGRAFQAIRDSEIAAQSVGINVAFYKTLSFAVSAFFVGVAGALLAIATGFINPDQFNFLQSILFLAMVVAGGRGSILGSVLGGTLLGFLTLKMDIVQDLPVFGTLLVVFSEKYMTTAGLPNVGLVFIGSALIAVNLLEPMGLYGIWIRARRYWTTWPF